MIKLLSFLVSNITCSTSSTTSSSSSSKTEDENEVEKKKQPVTKSTTSKPVQQKQQNIKEIQQIQDKIQILHFDQPGDLKGRQSIISLSSYFFVYYFFSFLFQLQFYLE